MRPAKEIRLGPQKPYDVIVCGAGHAGVEAALAASRMGVDVLLLSGNIDTIAQMSVTPTLGARPKVTLSEKSTPWGVKWESPPT